MLDSAYKMAFFLSVYAFGIIAFLIHVYWLPWKKRTKAKLIELFLLYQLVFSVGITSLLSFVGLTLMADDIAKYFEWPACPFQQELGNVNLAFGVLGILCIWFRGLFWLATIVGFSIWILGDGIHHLWLYFAYNNSSAGNIGAMLYTDMIVPVLLLILLFFYFKSKFASQQKL